MNFPLPTNRFFFSVLILLFTGLSLQAQNPAGQVTLREVLGQVEEQFGVSFTYADETIAPFRLPPPADSLTFTEVLTYLQQQTSLVFQQLDARFITISKPVAETIRICGYLVDDEDKTAITGATVAIANIYTISNQAGYFSLVSVPADSLIHIRIFGYKPLMIPATKAKATGKCKTFVMLSDTTRLQEVLISNYITAGINKLINGSFVVDVDNLGILPGLTEPDILHSIQALPGIQSINETVSDINIRGGTNDQNLVLWNGIRMYQTGHFFGLISAFNPYLNQDVSIIKNGASARYSEGISGIVSMRSDNTVAQKFTGSAGINMINADAFVKLPLTNKLTLQVSGRRAITDWWETPVFSNYFERAFGNTEITKNFTAGSDSVFNSNENFYFYDIGANLIYDISSKDKLRIHFLDIFNKLTYQENIESQTISDSKISRLTQQSIGATLHYQRLWSDKLKTTTQVYLSKYNLEATNYDVLNDQRLIQENEVVDIGVKLDALWLFNNNWDMLSGYQFQEIGVGNLDDINNPEFRRYIKRVVRTHAVFTEVNYQSESGKTIARLGVRANYYPKFNKVLIEPRLAFNQRFYQYLTLEILGEYRSQTASQIIDLQNDFLGVEKRRWVLANDNDIPLMQSKQVSLGVHFNKNGLLISVEGFYKYVKGMTSSSQGFQNQFQYIRATGNYTISGVEVLLNRQFNRFSAWAGYSFSDNQYEFPAFRPPVFANNLDITHVASLGFSVNIKKLELSTGLNWRTGKPYTLPTGVDNGEIIYDTPNSVRLPDYLRIDLSAKYSFKLTGKVYAQVGAAVWNLTNQKNVFNIYYQLDNQQNIREIEQLALRFTPNLMFRVKF